MSLVSEIVVQPRTGSQCPQTGANKNASFLSGYSSNLCQGTKNDDKQFSWNYTGTGAGVTLGFTTEVSAVGTDALNACKAVQPFSNEGGPKPWVFGNLSGGSNNSSRSFCIQPVEQLCYLDGQWDGTNYNPEEWKTTSLKNTFVSADFAGGQNGCVNSDNQTHYGGESPMMAQMCPVVCNYDATKFTTLDQVLEYEKMYSKYETDADLCIPSLSKSDTTQAELKSCLSNTRSGSSSSGKYNAPTVTGNPLSNNPNSKPFRQGYEVIMQRFCSNKMDDPSKCPIDPQTGKPMSKCSYLMSTGAEGSKCRAWLNSYGAHKWTQMNLVGSLYCSKNPDSPDCRCYSRLDSGNPDSSKFKQINSQIQQAAGGTEIPASCFYLPCADPTHYILSSDVFGMPSSDMVDYGPAYGFNCGTTVCTNIIKSGANTTMSGDSAYIQCSSSGPDDHHDDQHDKHNSGGGGSNSSVITNVTNGLPITDNVNVNRLLTVIIFLVAFLFLGFLGRFVIKSLSSTKGQTRSSSNNHDAYNPTSLQLVEDSNNGTDFDDDINVIELSEFPEDDENYSFE